MKHWSEKSKHVPGGSAVVVAILGETKILLIRETTKPQPWFWKFPGETVEPNESILSALKRGVEIEAGLADIKTRVSQGQIVAIEDPRVRIAKQLMPRQQIGSPQNRHWRHFWGLVLDNETIESLSGKHLSNPEEGEEIDTLAFDIAELDRMADFHPRHRELIQSLLLFSSPV